MIEQIALRAGFEISRVIKGGWQLSQGHSQLGDIDPLADMDAFVKAGFTTFDCADIYTGVEELIGRYIQQQRKKDSLSQDLKILTKFVPDYDKLASINKAYIESIIDRSLKRLHLERLDMVQFSWWTYDIPGWVETALWLKELQQAGKIHLVSSTNFNAETTAQIIEAGVDLATVQVQYSLIDHRPEKQLIDLCAKHGTNLLCYGTVAGGFLSEKWLGQPEPIESLENRSLVKYKLMIEEIGGWTVFQALLSLLFAIAHEHDTSLTNIATRYILDKPQVGAVIIGARNANHIDANLQVGDIRLTDVNKTSISSFLEGLSMPPGDVFDIERDKTGKHGSIMRYNLNDPAA
jgi:aryl-alcohol dehydrogenase-like predicted oxidoreductase